MKPKLKPSSHALPSKASFFPACLVVAVLTALPVSLRADIVQLFNPDWSILIDDFSYSDLALDQRPGFEGREYLSGEWAAAISYSRNSTPYGPTWLNPEFLYPDWETGSDFTIDAILEELPGRNAYGFKVARSIINNGSVRITITSEMIDTTNGIPQGLAPRSSSTPASLKSDRYVFRQFFQIDNISGQTLSGMKFFKFLHSLQAIQAVYDDRSYGPALNGFHYTISQQGTDLGWDATYSLTAVHSDTVSLHANLAPTGWEVGRYGIDGIDDHAGTNKPSVGVHFSVEAGKLSGLDSFGPTNQWVSGAVQCDLGTLPPNGSTNIEFLMSLETVTSTKDLRVVAWGSSLSDPAHIPAAATNILAIAAGGNHSVALRADGQVLAWGANSFGQIDVPAAASNVTHIAAGGNHSLALRRDGKVVAWGDNSRGQTAVPASLVGVEQLAAGANHSLALLSDGTIVGWGDNSYGQAEMRQLSGVDRIAAGSNFSLALQFNGTIVAWGDNSLGQLDVPTGMLFPVGIAAGASHALTMDGGSTVVGWGDNSEGQLDVPPGLEVQNIAAGGNHSLALLWDGTLVAWGSKAQGQDQIPAIHFPPLAIAAGGGHSLALAPIPPALRLTSESAGTLLSWPAAWAPDVEAVTLEESPSLGNGTWVPVTTPGQVIQGQYKVALPLGPAKKFYRLRIVP